MLHKNMIAICGFVALVMSCNGGTEPASYRTKVSPVPASESERTSAEFVEQNAQLHTIAIYESRTDHSGNNHPTGTTEVLVRGGHNVVLLLSSYEPTQWKIRTIDRSRVRKVILNGYHQQSVTGVDKSLVTSFFYDPSQSEAYQPLVESFDPYDRQALTRLQQAGERLTGLKGISLQNAYTGTSFVVGAHVKLDVVSMYQPSSLVPCESQNPKPNRCGTSTIKVYQSGYVDLVLSAYESVQWKIEKGPDTIIRRVLLSGYYLQTVTGAPEATIINLAPRLTASEPGLGDTAFPLSQMGRDQFLAKVRALEDLEISNSYFDYYGNSSYQFGRSPSAAK